MIIVNEKNVRKADQKINSSRMTNLRIDRRWRWETKGIVFVLSARAVYQRETRRCWYRNGSENRGTIFIGGSERSLPRLKVDRWKIVKMICWTMGIVRTDRRVWPPTIVAFRPWLLRIGSFAGKLRSANRSSRKRESNRNFPYSPYPFFYFCFHFYFCFFASYASCLIVFFNSLMLMSIINYFISQI